MLKKNITISLNESLTKKLKVAAAKKEKSVSKFLAELLENFLEDDDHYQKAMNDYLSRPNFIESKGEPYPKKEDLYE